MTLAEYQHKRTTEDPRLVRFTAERAFAEVWQAKEAVGSKVKDLETEILLLRAQVQVRPAIARETGGETTSEAIARLRKCPRCGREQTFCRCLPEDGSIVRRGQKAQYVYESHDPAVNVVLQELQGRAEQAEKRLAEVEARVQRLREQIDDLCEYAAHHGDCEIEQTEFCTCGLGGRNSRRPGLLEKLDPPLAQEEEVTHG